MQHAGNGTTGSLLPVIAVTVVRRAAFKLGLESLECAAALLTLHDALCSQIYMFIENETFFMYGTKTTFSHGLCGHPRQFVHGCSRAIGTNQSACVLTCVLTWHRPKYTSAPL